jgi:uncharacterized DUF497 family protein
MTKVLQNALKHGLTEKDVAYAWGSLLRCRQRMSNDEPTRWIAVGLLPNGQAAELVAFQDVHGEWNVFHAMAPPTKKFIKELGL